MAIPIEDLGQVRRMEEHQTFDAWLENCRPVIAVEVISASTLVGDFVTKSSRYARLGVGEFYVFDPQGELLETPVQGFRLQDREFIALDSTEDKILCAGSVQLHMRREGIFLQLVDPTTGEKVLSSLDLPAKVDEMEEKVRATEQYAAAETQRAEAAEAENLRLRELLATYRSKGAEE